MATVRQVNPAYVQQIWPDVEEMLTKALEHSAGEYSSEQMKVYITQGNWALLVADNEDSIIGACVVCFEQYPNDRVAFVTAIGGRFIARSDLFAQLEAWAKSQGCTKIRGAARESIARLWRQKFDVQEIYRIVEKAL